MADFLSDGPCAGLGDARDAAGDASPDRMRFVFKRACDDADLTAATVALKDKVFQSEAWCLLNFQAEDLLARDALIGATVGRRGPLSALHAVIDGIGTAYIQGVVTDPGLRRRGLGEATLRETLLVLANGLKLDMAALIVRVRADGTVNEAAFSTFRKLGFWEGEEFRVQISGSPLDAHLRASAEGNGTFFRARRMHLDLSLWRLPPRDSEAV